MSARQRARRSPLAPPSLRALVLGALAPGALVLGGCAATMPRAFVGGSVPTGGAIAILPLANYTQAVNASDKVIPALALELARQRDVRIVDAGVVERVVGNEPWLLLDRVPPDILERFGEELGASGVILGSVLAYGYRSDGAREVPDFGISLRLLEVPGGRLLWSAVYARNGAEGESVFGMGRVESVDRLVNEGAKEIMATFPPAEPIRTGGSS